MKHQHCCGCHKRIGDYNLCHRCGTIISRAKSYCSSCEKSIEQENKKEEKENKKKAKTQKKELERQPPHQCVCEPQLFNTGYGMQVFNKETEKYEPLHPLFGYNCQRDERTGVLVCKKCGGTPPKGAKTRENFSL
ncbi:MAG: hypothetical protein LBO09_03280 [Candidatus Peribacteria bacterium]|jgi:hypothetical protein|nr:hypothetical protein [Candidatus Peribacteria bacterium]